MSSTEPPDEAEILIKHEILVEDLAIDKCELKEEEEEPKVEEPEEEEEPKVEEPKDREESIESGSKELVRIVQPVIEPEIESKVEVNTNLGKDKVKRKRNN